MKKIIMSLSVVAAVAAIAVGATTAFFSDTETSTGNTFTAGSIDLRVDNTCHYWNYIGGTNDEGMGPGWHDVGCPTGTPADNDHTWVSSWSETDLKNGVHKFFNFGDLKPGDWGEDTISLHVYDNDAWGKMKIKFYNNKDNGCTEPEGSLDTTCGGETDTPDVGELLGQMTFETWLDQGAIPGFQCRDSAVGTPSIPRCPIDPWEGDNIWQKNVEVDLPDDGGEVDVNEPTIPTEMIAMDLIGGNPVPVVNPDGSRVKPGDPDFDRASFFDVFVDLDGAMKGLTAGGNPICPANDGHNTYNRCHGIAFDGRLVGSTTYYIGWAWHLPNTVGNNAQTDSVMGDMSFMVVQHRNNPTQSGL